MLLWNIISGICFVVYRCLVELTEQAKKRKAEHVKNHGDKTNVMMRLKCCNVIVSRYLNFVYYIFLELPVR